MKLWSRRSLNCLVTLAALADSELECHLASVADELHVQVQKSRRLDQETDHNPSRMADRALGPWFAELQW